MKARIIHEMRSLFGDDRRRINHALSVLTYAETLLKTEPADDLTVVAAAILHDIGIHEAERKYHSSAGNYQEIEGPPIARAILERVGVDPVRTDVVCRIISLHHHATGLDTPEFRILWDADWLVNIPDEYPGWEPARLRPIVRKVFKTDSGRTLAEILFL
ncbi:MAG: HD domain-containing protein [bacterium]